MIKFEEMTYYPMSESLTKVFNSNRVRLVTSGKNILKDEEYLDENDSFQKCYSCDNESITRCVLNRSNYSGVLFQLYEDAENYSPYIKYEYSEEYLRMEEIIQDYLNYKDYIFIEYCSKCKKILKIDEILFFTIEELDDFDIYMTILEQEKYIDGDGEPLKCMVCDGTDFVNKNIYTEDGYEVEFSIHCKCCDTKVAHWAYGNYC